MQNCAFIIRVIDGNVNGLELIVPCPQVVQEIPDVASLWTPHVHEGLVKVGLHIIALGCESVTDSIPLLLSGGELLNI